MSTPTKKDCLVEGSTYELDLAKLTGKKVVGLYGYASSEFGPTFKLTRVVFEDGTSNHLEGEHDHPYITGDAVTEEMLEALLKEDGE